VAAQYTYENKRQSKNIVSNNRLTSLEVVSLDRASRSNGVWRAVLIPQGKAKCTRSGVAMGTPDYPSGIPDMHTIHDPMISVS
jgi:hypothetical protein